MDGIFDSGLAGGKMIMEVWVPAGYIYFSIIFGRGHYVIQECRPAYDWKMARVFRYKSDFLHHIKMHYTQDQFDLIMNEIEISQRLRF